MSEGITVDRRTLDPCLMPCAEGERSNGKTADLGPWRGVVRRDRRGEADD